MRPLLYLMILVIAVAGWFFVRWLRVAPVEESLVGPTPSAAMETDYSPHGVRVAVVVNTGATAGVIVDGQGTPNFSAVGAHTTVFSADSRHVAYAGAHGDQWCVVVDGKEQP